MIKYFGLMLIMAASVMIGLYLSGSLKQRVQILMNFRAVLWQFKLDISYRMMDIKELLLKDMKPCFSHTADIMVSNLESGFTLPESAKFAIDNAAVFDVLKEDELSFIISVLSQLGISDAEGQISLFDNAIEKMDYYINNALEDKQKNSKIYLTSAIYFGALVVIILL